jgi:predicted acylesterase/phospholipase RssA
MSTGPSDTSKQVQKYRHLVFSGGGIKGLSYIGCFKALEELGALEQLETCVGCSAGAIMATLIVLGYKPVELYDIILYLDPQQIRNLNFLRAFNNYGLETGERITSFLAAMIKKKCGDPQITFKKLYEFSPIRLVINATNLNNYKVAYFDHVRTPDVPVLLAIRMSISIPFLIKPVTYQKEFYVDGGILDNLPISQVPDCPEALAFDLEPVTTLKNGYKIDTLESYTYHVFGCIYTEINQIRMLNIKQIKLIKLDTQEITSLSINITAEQRICLFNIGYHTVLEALKL